MEDDNEPDVEDGGEDPVDQPFPTGPDEKYRIADDDEDNVVEENVGSDQLNLLGLK